MPTRFLSVVVMQLLILAPVAGALAGPGADKQTASVSAVKLDAAQQAFSDQDWPAAVEAYRALTNENPYNGRFWYQLATALYTLKDYEASAGAYMRAVEVGHAVPTSLYNMACDYALLGRTDDAVAAIEEAIRKVSGNANS